MWTQRNIAMHHKKEVAVDRIKKKEYDNIYTVV